jgi:exonuclease I
MEEKVIKASLDRIEGDFAVVYTDDDDDDHHKFDVPVELVNGAKPGMRLQLHIENNQIKRIEIDREGIEEAKDRIRKKYEMLRRGRHLK